MSTPRMAQQGRHPIIQTLFQPRECGVLKIAADAPALWATARTPAATKPEPRASWHQS